LRALCLTLPLILVLWACKKEPVEPGLATIIQAQGQVTVRHGSETVAGGVGQAIYKGDVLTTGPASTARVRYVNGVEVRVSEGSTHLDAAGQRGDRRIGAVDAAIAADRLDAVEVVGVGDLGRDYVSERRPVAGDRAVEVAEALQRQLDRRPGGSRRADGLTLRHQPGGGGQKS
jgi:hypothetical protein